MLKGLYLPLCMISSLVANDKFSLFSFPSVMLEQMTCLFFLYLYYHNVIVVSHCLPLLMMACMVFSGTCNVLGVFVQF